MNPENYFFLIFLLTVIAVRFFLWLKPTPSPTVRGFRFHHWMLGTVLMLISLPLKSLLFYAIGLGLFVDELTYIIIRGKNHEDNYSRVSIVGTILLVVLIYFLRKHLVF